MAAKTANKRNLGREARLMLSHPLGWIASGFGSGLSPRAPGTTGSAALVMLFWLLGAQAWPWWGHAAVLLGGLALGTWASAYACRVLGFDDAGVIVIDEWVGQWLTYALALAFWPFAHGEQAVLGFYLAGFLLFRAADIAKPWPARGIDRGMGGGLGVMLDDVVAGVYAGLALSALGYVIAANSLLAR